VSILRIPSLAATFQVGSLDDIFGFSHAESTVPSHGGELWGQVTGRIYLFVSKS